MLLTEDYFKDIEITDNDITSQDEKDYDANPAQWFKGMKSRYTHCLVCLISNSIVSKSNMANIIQTKVPYVLKKLQYTFDAYGIDYSEPVFQTNGHQFFLEQYANECEFADYHGYRMIRYVNHDNNDITDYYIYMVMFFNLPKINSYIAACRFISNIMRCLWSNKNYNESFRRFFIQGFNSSGTTYTNNVIEIEDDIYRQGRIYKIPKRIVINSICMFYPENDQETLANDLFLNSKLYSKLKYCFA